MNVALIGYGYAGQTFHAPLIESVPGLNLSLIISSKPEKVNKDLPDLLVCPKPEFAFESEKVDLIVIATPNDTHFDLCKRALEAGKHVVVDKPFTTTASQARELIELAEKKEVLLSIFHNRRYDADFLTLRRLLEKGILGQISHFESHFDRYRPHVKKRWREQSIEGGGLWYDLGSHLVDQALQLFGAPESIQADLAVQREEAEAVDYFHVVLRYGTTRVILHASTLCAAESARFIVHGNLGSYVKYGLDTQEESLKNARHKIDSPDWGLDEKNGILITYEKGNPKSVPVPTEKGDYASYYAAVKESIDNGAPNPVSPNQALTVMEIIELGYASELEAKRLDFTSSH
ncbi:MAG: oxidoreductase [Candidatus Obscuribacterales bacterium]|nr:oxidoreductase [Candidatus Obscuribacterales bacterium]